MPRNLLADYCQGFFDPQIAPVVDCSFKHFEIMMQDQAGLLRHSIRGTINALKLGVSALDTDVTQDESIEFLEYIVQATEKMCTLLDQYDQISVSPPAPQTSRTTAST